MNNRQAIFTAVSSRLDRNSSAKLRAENVSKRLHENRSPVVPSYLQETNHYLDLFCNKARNSQAKVYQLKDIKDLSACIDKIILAQTSKANLFLSSNCKDLNINLSTNIRLLQDVPNIDASWGLSLALAGAAESGTVLVASKNTSPITLNITPENSITILESTLIFSTLEKAIHKGYQTKPRAMICVTGPYSRTADIAQSLVMGTHGPKALHIIIVPTLF